MEIYFSTVIRKSPLAAGGELVRLDWETKEVLGKRTMSPPEPHFEDPNPRGNGRGGRGITRCETLIYAATYHSLLVLNRELKQVGIISDYLFVGIHELFNRQDKSLWVTSTAIDAVVGIDYQGNRIDSWWPRENLRLQQHLSLQPFSIDKMADNRTQWLNDKDQKSEGHTHLNAVAFYDNQMFVLLNRHGVVFNASSQDVLVEDTSLIGGHNLVFINDHLLINDSNGMRILVYSVSGRKIKELSLLKYPEVRAIYNRSRVNADICKRTIFVRGLCPIDGQRILVGFSPATIVEIDLESGKLLDIFQYSKDVAVSPHGLMAW